MMRSLFSGVSGLKNQQFKMDIIGNNISNINTIGFKGSRIHFAEELSQIMRRAHDGISRGSQNAIAIGLGVRTSAIDRNFTQGILQTTGKETDLGVDGDGFFVVSDGTRNLFTRSGNFHFDGNSRMIASNGFFVQGYMADQTGQLPRGGSLSNIVFDASVISPAKSTQNLAIAGNLDSGLPTHETWTASKTLTVAATGASAVGTTDLNDLAETTTPLVGGDVIIISGSNPDGSSISSTFTYGAGNDGTTIDDLLASINGAFTGVSATLENGLIVLKDASFGDSSSTISLAQGTTNTGLIALPSFVNTAKGLSPQASSSIEVFDSLGATHTLNILFTKTEKPREWSFSVTLAGDEIIKAGSTGTLTFKTDGSLETVIYDNSQSLLVFAPGAGAEDVSLNLDFENSVGFSGLTQFSGTSAVSMPYQDGQAQGNLTSFAIDQDGRILGSFSNGRTQVIAQLALAEVSNPEGLIHIGNNIYEITGSAGVPVIREAGEDLPAAIVSGTLEASNVDLSAEFSEMIIAQRAFQANARIITVSDQFLNEVTQLKR